MSQMLDAVGRRRSPATMLGFHAGRPPRNKGVRYPADPPTVEEIVSVMRAAGDSPHGQRLRGMIAVLWRAGLRISEALALAESDLDAHMIPVRTTLTPSSRRRTSRKAILQRRRITLLGHQGLRRSCPRW